MKAISACLLGVACRYDGRPLDPALQVASPSDAAWVPLCPEQLGGLATPRIPAQITGGSGEDVLVGRARVINEEGEDVTEAFLRGAHEALALCRRLGVTEVHLKARSPSCGAGQIYRGRALVPGQGVAAALLAREGLRLVCRGEGGA